MGQALCAWVRVGATRVLAELVIRAFQDGSTPEVIAQRYSALTAARGRGDVELVDLERLYG
jgi:hypothetical protein